MLTAKYNIASGDWTRAMDAALSEWSKYIIGNAEFRIDIKFVTGTYSMLAGTVNRDVNVGVTDEGLLTAPASLLRIQGGEASTADMTFYIETSYAWSFDGPAAGKYHATTALTHELGHGLGIIGVNTTPFDIENHQHLANPSHLADKGALMWTSISAGTTKLITAADVQAVSDAGMPTRGNDTIYVIGPRVDGGPGDDVAVWLGKFDAFQSDLINIERLELRGTNPLTAEQVNLYRLYAAAFGRDPDLEGFTWWDAQDVDIHTAARGFAGSDEFADLYGAPDHDDLITALYWNILDREPEAAGYEYWLGRTDMDAAELVTEFALAPENAVETISFSLA